MPASTGYKSRLLAAAMLLALTACTTTDVASVEEPPAAPMTGQTNDPAPGFESVKTGSEEDFILNVGRRIYFAQDSAKLDSVAMATLDNQAAWLNRNPSWLIKLQGFADDSGSESKMKTLSQQRADATMAYLASKGVDARRMWARGYGNDREVRDCTERSCKVQNRRVVANLRAQRDES
ncbi:outer membrane protein OmpA-like peptidoglycan-associated protein [Rhizobium pisi]|jgi:outer membrane protein OmpA-like peptidoglycan-associated protein|uniref:OmpA family protein n=2 Tax=Rhizobium TaxID=379 RepID=A0A7W6B9I7_9HYPH|nr:MULTISPECIES: OmpA family protein [Rhizobium]MBB3137074.1 outer membrane protein OmpA-like peptidoglycan-associated protein [Rhizobium pisi]MBB3913816.1 outer membrane protein OmpA-like peptidoglycan-associated protein [Rhizobium fabae]RSB66694.1 OmpA family protein [Rhizobium pisi]RUM13570.1 OmpA family protein [Rhizobium fabae]TCA50101.1 OmpA family protein [Rhizobium pisi]